MTRRIARFMIPGLAAILVGAVITGCFGGGEPEVPTPTPTVDIQATIRAAVDAAVPADTPTPEPTETPTPTVPPTPNIAATLAAMLAAQQVPTQPPPTPVPTDTPVPTAVPTVVAASTPTTGTNPMAGPPAIIIGKVTIGGATAPEGTLVHARPKDRTLPPVQDQTDEKGNYQLNITNIGTTYDLWVEGKDSNLDTDMLTRGGLQKKDLSVS